MEKIAEVTYLSFDKEYHVRTNDIFETYCSPESLDTVLDFLEEKGFQIIYLPDDLEPSYTPETYALHSTIEKDFFEDDELPF